jgi:IPT/TIG domain/S-layer homology domain
MKRCAFAVLVAAAVLFAAPLSAGSVVFTVVNTNDAGAGSLRQAILDAGALGAGSVIAFAIPGSGPHTITLLSELPNVFGPVIIDGYTQAGSSPNTLPDGDDAVLQVVVSGASLPDGSTGFNVIGSGNVLQGLVINGFSGHFSIAVSLEGTGSHRVSGCFIGTDASGTAAVPNYDGIAMESADNLIGGTTPADRNLISGNEVRGVIFDFSDGNFLRGNFIGTDRNGTSAVPNGEGVHTFSPATNSTIGGAVAGSRNVISGNPFGGLTVSSTGFFIQGNYIGTDVTGTLPLGNGFNGLFLNNADGNIVGGTDPLARNVISGNGSTGLVVGGSGQNLIVGNRIGTDVTGALPLGNGHSGILLFGSAGSTVDNEIGSAAIPDAGNIIAFNGHDGITIVDDAAVRNSIRRNSIYRNGDLGIDLGDDGATANDGGDVDFGPNANLNFPLLRSVSTGGGNTTILGAFRGAPNTTVALEFFSNPCNFRPRAFLQGQTFLGETQVTTDGNGFADLNVVLPVTVEAGSPVSATATDALGNSSEFAQQIVFSIFPASGPAAGGTPVTISGTNFDPGVAVSIGGLAPGNLVLVNDAQLTAEAPALPPGSLNDVVVTNPDTTAGTLLKGWVADFLDVPAAHQFHDFVTRLVSNGVTVGCGGGSYCVNNPTTRQQMAVFLIRARLGFCFTPPPATGTVFPDVPSTNIFAPWIEELQRQGLTAGCGGGNYCPDASVTRAQMAVFLLNTAYGPGYVPPPATGAVFDDVPLGAFADAWIEDLVARGITAGCSVSPSLYCPGNPITRGQMATFITITFALQP